MAHRSGQRIRAVIGPWVVVERKHVAYHVDHLALVGCTRTHNGLLDLHGRILPHLEPRLGTGHDGRATRLGGCDGRTHVLAEEDLLYGKLRRSKALDRIAYLSEDHACLGGNATIGTRATHRATSLHYAPTRVCQAGIYSKNDHVPPQTNDCSIVAHTSRLWAMRQGSV